MSALLNEDERALPDAVRSFLDKAVRSFLDKKVAPLVAAHEQARTFPWELLPQLYDFGYVRGGVPGAAGGDELPMMMQAILMEEAGRCWGSLRTTVNVLGMVARVLGAAAGAGQAERFLQPLLAGRATCSASSAAASRSPWRPSTPGASTWRWARWDCPRRAWKSR
jgi:acyl-CoA dehydrogenase